MTLNGMKRILGDFFFFFFSYEKLSFWNCRHVSRVWDHAHQISGEILPHFDPSHLSVAQRDQKLEKHVSTRDGHVPRVWDHTHWIPGEILPHFDPSHLSVAQRDQKLQNHVSTRDGHVTDTCHVSGTMSIGFLVKFYPIFM